ncbi:MFS transporter [Cupriavidus oxalaticus]|uniref:MFS transporter n=1 Tax=Cupriavidus oxalaticus TaxID=96344 RepID=A0A4P7LMY4_9BURK|nr:MFS transporter [Cupriavidus oxalaticus]QBY56199.1 MFS transporter [Cupriavidus oxalaticus]
MTDQKLTPQETRRTVRKIIARTLPFAFFLYAIAFLDRVNLGYAALQMNHELGLTSEAFGFAAGLFFIGNVLFEVPSNFAMMRYGPRIWIARIIITWGLIAALTAFVQSATQLYLLRFLLGVAEAGFIPGMVYYFSLWVLERDRALVMGAFLVAMPVTYLAGAPLSTGLMAAFTAVGLSGWRWMLFVEAVPAIFGGIACYWLLPERPAAVSWLSQREKQWLEHEFEREQIARPQVQHLSPLQVLVNPIVLFLSLIYFLSQMGALGIGFWLPQIVREFSREFSLTTVGLLSGLPYAVTTVGVLVWARLSDVRRERKWFTVVALAIGGVGLLIAGTSTIPVAALVAITVALLGIFANKPTFFAMLNDLFSKPTLAISVAVITAIGNMGGFVGPYLVGIASHLHGAAKGGLFVMSGSLLVAALLTALLRVERPPRGRR